MSVDAVREIGEDRTRCELCRHGGGGADGVHGREQSIYTGSMGVLGVFRSATGNAGSLRRTN